MAAKGKGLLIATQADAALTPEQRKYKQLVARIAKVRAELLAWQEHVPLFAQAHAQRVRPLLRQLAAERRLIVLELARLLASKPWSRADASTLRRALCELAADLLADEFIEEATATELEALYNQHAETSLDDEKREALGDLKNMIEAMAGLDLGDETFTSEEALRQRAQEKLHAKIQQEQQAAAAQTEQRPTRKNAAQRKREAHAAEATQSVREVFRKLASALHPDRATDEADRGRRTALMQRVNQAYATQDLLALFALQLEIEQIDPEHLARASTERIRHYNHVLASQLAELLNEIEARVDDFGTQFGIEPWRRLKPTQLGPLIEEEVRGLRATLVRAGYELKALQGPDSVKRWIKEMRQQQKLDDSDPFDMPF